MSKATAKNTKEALLNHINTLSLPELEKNVSKVQKILQSREGVTLDELSYLLDKSKETIIKIINILRRRGYDVNINETSQNVFLERVQKKEIQPLSINQIGKRSLKILVISDTHLGSKYQQLTILHNAFDEAKKEKVDFAIHCGDVVDGCGLYKGQIAEIFLHTAEDQLEYAAKMFPSLWDNRKTYLIGGSHDLSFKKQTGYNILKHLCEKRRDLIYLGDETGELQVKNINIRVLHPSGGVAYARSYRPQKIAEAITSQLFSYLLKHKNFDKLVRVLLLGHWHIPNYIPGYMSVETISMMGLQAQTPYLAAKGLAPVIGYLILELKFDKDNNVVQIVPDFRIMNAYIKERDF